MEFCFLTFSLKELVGLLLAKKKQKKNKKLRER